MCQICYETVVAAGAIGVAAVPLLVRVWHAILSFMEKS